MKGNVKKFGKGRQMWTVSGTHGKYYSRARDRKSGHQDAGDSSLWRHIRGAMQKLLM